MVYRDKYILILSKKNKGTNNSSQKKKHNGSQLQTPFLANEIKFDKQIDIPNPRLQPNGILSYTLFGGSASNIELSPSAITNNAYNPELEKL
jgi:hypothetical protein